MQHPSSGCTEPGWDQLDGGPRDGDAGGRRGLLGMFGWALWEKQPLPISCIQRGDEGIPHGQQEAKAYPLCTCPVSGLHKGGLSRAPSSSEPGVGHFSLAFCSVAPSTRPLSWGPVLRAPRMCPQHTQAPCPCCHRGPHRGARTSGCLVLLGTGRMAAELVGRRCGMSHNCCTLMSPTSSLRDPRYLQQTCAWHLAANPGISGCGGGGRWSLARPGPPGCHAAHGLGTVWVA